MAATGVDHICLYKFKDDMSPNDIQLFIDEANAIAAAAGGLVRYAGGKNVSHEGQGQGYTHGFIMTFDSEESRKTYLWHQARIAFRDKWLPRVENWLEMDF